MFEWQRHSQDSREVAQYTALLEFLDFQVHASENSQHETNRRRQIGFPEKMSTKLSYCITWTSPISVGFVKRVSIPYTHAKSWGHCHKSKWWQFSRSTGIELTASSQDSLSSNVLVAESAGYVKSLIIPGSILLKKGLKQTKEVSPSKQRPGTVTYHSDLGGRHPVVLTTYQVHIVSADSSTTKARALFDSASSTLLITESLAECLHLQHRRYSMQVGSISGSATRLFSCRMVDLNISNHHGDTLAVEVVVLLKVSSNLPPCLVPFNCKWKHLSNIRMAAPDFGIPGCVDLLLGADVFSHTMLHGWRFGPLGSPSTFKTCFCWVLIGATHTNSHSNWLNR